MNGFVYDTKTLTKDKICRRVVKILKLKKK